GVRVDAADRRERAAPAARVWLVRAGLQRRAHRLAVRRQRQRLVVDDHYGAPAGGDADSARKQPGSGAAVCAVGGRCHRLAVCAAVSVDFRPMKVRASVRSTVVLVAGLLMTSARTEAGERQIRPFIGVTFGGGTTFVLNNAVGKPNPAIGASAVLLGEVFGAEVDVADAPGFFEPDGKHQVL